jgi:hypothetical protein
MSNAPRLFDAFLSIMTECINSAGGKCDDAEVCATIAAYINMLPFTVYYSHDLYDFIHEYGEDEDYTYLGRDAEGEKQYIVHNPETHWHERIRKELVKLGHYKRHNEYWQEQEKLKQAAA